MPIDPLPPLPMQISEDLSRPGDQSVTCRELSPEEIQREVLPDYEKTGNLLPDPAISTFMGVFDGPNLLGYLCLQVKLHAQPLVIRPGHQSILSRLIHGAEEHIARKIGPTWTYVFAPPGRLGEIPPRMGWVEEPWKVFSKLVTGSPRPVETEIPEVKMEEIRADPPPPARKRIPIWARSTDTVQ